MRTRRAERDGLGNLGAKEEARNRNSTEQNNIWKRQGKVLTPIDLLPLSPPFSQHGEEEGAT